MMTPRNGFVILSLIEKSEYRAGAIIVPAGAELFSEALVVGVPVDNSSTRDLKLGQIVYGEVKRKVGPPTAQQVVHAGMPFKQGKHEYLIIEESQIIGILAQGMNEYAESQKANSLAATEERLLQ